jgi:hypothetical protein
MWSQEGSERGKVRARGVLAKCRILRSGIQPRERSFTESRAGCPEFGAGDGPAGRATGQIKLRRIDGWQKIATVLSQNTSGAALNQKRGQP